MVVEDWGQLVDKHQAREAFDALLLGQEPPKPRQSSRPEDDMLNADPDTWGTTPEAQAAMDAYAEWAEG